MALEARARLRRSLGKRAYRDYDIAAMRLDTTVAAPPAIGEAAASHGKLRLHLAATWLTLACLLLIFVYIGLIPSKGLLLEPWLKHLSPRYVPLERLLTGALWLCALVELAGGDHAWLGARHRALRPLLTATFAGALFYTLRDTRCELGDSPALLRDPIGAVLQGDAYTFVEELAGMWLPLRLARARLMAGTPVISAIVDGYRIVSIGFGMAYAAAVTHAATHTRAPRLFALLMFGHAALLHFMGYVENYVGAFSLLALGFLSATSALARGVVSRRRTLQTTFLFSVAALFHGVAVWSVFSLVALAFYTERGARPVSGLAKVVLTNTALGLITLLVGYLCFRWFLAPGVGTVHVTPLVRGGPTLPLAISVAELQAVRPAHEHALAILRVGMPALVAITAGIVAAPNACASLLRERDVRFALTYLLGFSIHQLLWRSTLGTYRDWDLFGFSALPLAYLGARVVALIPRSRVVYALLLLCCTLGGLCWPLAQTGVALNLRDRVAPPWER